ncbi:MAG: hypothetical protein U1F43_22555 [Myxococcota bacterium]
MQMKGEAGEAPAKASEKSADQQLKELVRLERKDQIAAIEDHLDDATITDGDVEKVLRVLETMDGPTIGALMGALPAKMLQEFVENINEPHVGRWRREVLESCFAAWPAQLKDIDTDVITKMDLAGLSPRETLQVGYIIRNLPKGSVEDIFDSKNGPKVKAIMTTPSSYSKEDFDKATQTALGKEKKRAGIASEDHKAIDKDQQLAKTGQSMVEILKGFIVTDAEATTILDWFAGLVVKPGENPQLDEGKIRALARYLEEQKQLDTFIDNLPTAVRWQKGPRSQAFLLVLKARPPEKNMRMAEDLLSYGVFDWAITDAEAKLAYYLVKSMPAGMQERFRRADGSKWFARMEHEQSDEMLAAKKVTEEKDGKTTTKYETEYKGVETEVDPETGEAKDVSEQYAKKLEEEGTGSVYAQALDLCKGGLDRASAQKLYTLLAGHRDSDGLKAIVRRLDTANNVAVMCEQLGNGFLFADQNRLTSLRIFMARDPVHQAFHARALVSYRFGDLNVNSEEALLAYNLVKALPEGERKAFVESENGKWWGRIDSHLTHPQKEHVGTNPYNGGKDGQDQNKLRAQLLDDANWEAAAGAKLQGLVRMAAVAGDGAWVFAESKRRETYKVLPQVAAKYGLFHPSERPTYVPEAMLDEPGSVVTEGIGFIAASKHVVTASYLGGEGLSLPALQDVMGGSVVGMRFSRHEDLGKEGADAKEKQEGVNFAKMAKFDTDNGVLDLDAPDIALEAMTLFVGDKKISTKKGAIKGLKVTFRYPTPSNPLPVYLEAEAASVDLSDVMLIGPGSMQTMNRVAFSGFFAKIARPGMTKEDVAKAATEDRVPIPIIGGLVSTMVNIFRDFGAQGQAMGKAFTDPGSPLGIELRLGDLVVEGMATSGGQSIDKIQAKGLSLGGGQTRSAFLEAKIRSLRAKIGAASKKGDTAEAEKLEGQVKSLETDLVGAKAEDAKLFALQDKYRKDPKGFSADDQKQLDLLQAQQKTGGMVLDVEEASVQGLAGSVSADDVSLKNLHGEGSGEAMGFGLLTDGKLIDDFAKRGPPKKPSESAALKGASAHVDLGDVEVKNLKVKSEIPTLKETDLAIAKLKEKIDAGAGSDEDRASRAELEALRPDVARYEELESMGLTNLEDAPRAEFQALHAKLGGRLALEVKRLALQGASADLAVGKDLKSATVGVSAKGLDAESVKAGGFEVGTVHGENIAVDAQLGSLADALDPRKALKGGSVKADKLEAGGIRDKTSGVEVDKVKVEKLGLQVSDVDKDATAELRAGVIEVSGINMTGKIKVMEAEYAKLAAIPAKDLKPEQKERKLDLERALKEHVVLEDKVKAATEALEKAKGSNKEAGAKSELARAQTALRSWSEAATRLTLTDVSLVASGLGNVTGAGYDPKQALANGVTIAGSGPDGQMIGGVEATGVKAGGATADVAKLAGVKGSVGIKGNEVSFTKLGMSSATVSGLRYAGGGTSLAVTGSAGLTGLSMTGKVSFEEVMNDETKQLEKKPARAHIDTFEIAEVTGAGIALGMPAKNFSLSIPNGRIGRIWAKDVDVALPKSDGGETKITGAGGIDAWNIPALQAKLGQGLAYNGSLSGSGLKVGLAADGKRELDLEKLDAHGLVTMAQGTSIAVSVTGLSGKVTQQGDDIVLSKVRVGDLTVGGGTHWEGSGKSIDIGKMAKLKGIYVDARLKTKTTGEGDKAKTELTSVVLDTVVVDNIDAEDVRAKIDAVKEDPAKKQEASPEKRLHLEKAVINGLRVKGLDVFAQKGNVHVDSLDATGLHAAVGEIGRESLTADASLKGTGLDLTLLGPDRQVIDLGETDVNAQVQTGDVKADVDAKGLKGKIETFPDGYVLTNIGLSTIDVPYAKYAAPGTLVQLDKGGRIEGASIEKLEVRFMTVQQGNKTEKQISSLIVKELRFDKVTANSLTYAGAKTVTDDSGKTTSSSTAIILQSATLNDLKLHELNQDMSSGKTKLNAELGKADLKGFDAAFRKQVGKDPAVTYGLAGDIFANTLSANVTAREASEDGAPYVPLTGTASIGSAGISNFRVTKDSNLVAKGDKVEATGTNGKPAVSATFDDKGTKVETGDITGTNLTVPLGTGTVSLQELKAMGSSVQLSPTGEPEWAIIPHLSIGPGKTKLPGFSFTDNGVEVNVKSGEADNIRAYWSGGKLTEARIGGVTLKDGDFALDFQNMPSSGGGGGGGTPAPDMSFLKGLNGSLNVQFYWWYNVVGGRGLDNTENVTMKITQGAFNAKAFEDAFGTAVDWFAIDFSSDLFKSSHGSVGLLHLNIGGDKVSVAVSEEDEKQFSDKGEMKLNHLVKLIEQYADVVKDKAKKDEAEEKKTGKKKVSDLYLPMDRVKVDANLTIDPGTEVVFPRVGKIKVGQGDGPKSNAISVKGSPGSAIDIGLDDVALNGIDWKTAGVAIDTGRITLDTLKTKYDIAQKKVSGVLTTATLKDANIKF